MVLTFELHFDCNNPTNVAFRVYVTGSRQILLRLVQMPQHELHIETESANFLKRQWSDFWNLFENYLKTIWKHAKNHLNTFRKLLEDIALPALYAFRALLALLAFAFFEMLEVLALLCNVWGVSKAFAMFEVLANLWNVWGVSRALPCLRC